MERFDLGLCFLERGGPASLQFPKAALVRGFEAPEQPVRHRSRARARSPCVDVGLSSTADAFYRRVLILVTGATDLQRLL